MATSHSPALPRALTAHSASGAWPRVRIARSARRSSRLRRLSTGGQDTAATPDPRAKAYAQRAYARALAVSAQVAEQRGAPQEADALFTEALSVIGQTGYVETAGELELRYAELLTARGAYAEASQHYQAAAIARARGDGH